MVQELISSHSAMGFLTTLKIYFLHSNFGFFPSNVLPFCEKHHKFTTRIFPKLRRATLDNGVLICRVITTVILYEIQKLAKIGGKRRRRERL